LLLGFHHCFVSEESTIVNGGADRSGRGLVGRFCLLALDSALRNPTEPFDEAAMGIKLFGGNFFYLSPSLSPNCQNIVELLKVYTASCNGFFPSLLCPNHLNLSCCFQIEQKAFDLLTALASCHCSIQNHQIVQLSVC